MDYLLMTMMIIWYLKMIFYYFVFGDDHLVFGDCVMYYISICQMVFAILEGCPDIVRLSTHPISISILDSTFNIKYRIHEELK